MGAILLLQITPTFSTQNLQHQKLLEMNHNSPIPKIQNSSQISRYAQQLCQTLLQKQIIHQFFYYQHLLQPRINISKYIINKIKQMPQKYLLLTLILSSLLINVYSIAEAISAGAALASLTTSTIDQILRNIDYKIVVAIQIRNGLKDFDFIHPSYYLSSGVCHQTCSNVLSMTRQFCAFRKTADAATGSCGVLLYQIRHKSSFQIMPFKLFLYFQNPYSGKNQFCVGIVNSDIYANQQLYDDVQAGKSWLCKKKYAKEGSSTQVSNFKGKRVQISADMNEVGKSKIIINVEQPQHKDL